MKHAIAWTMRQLENGILEFTSPLGIVIRDEPEPQGPRFVELTEQDIFWGIPVRAASERPNAPPIPAPF